MNYQYRFGTGTSEAIAYLYAQRGWPRFYDGLPAALIQGPLARFGDTAANAGILALLRSNPLAKQLPALVKTIFASIAAAAFRTLLMPIDTVKTTMQAQGRPGMAILKARVSRSHPCELFQMLNLIKIKQYGVQSLWYGALGAAAATFVGHYPVGTMI